jgi:hypothetical protein
METTATLTELLTQAGSSWVDAELFRPQNECIEYIIERFDDYPEALKDFFNSDWVNLCEPYTHQLLDRYHTQEQGIKALFNDYCEVLGATSTLEALEGVTIEDPEDMMAAMVNAAMSWGAMELCREVYLEF